MKYWMIEHLAIKAPDFASALSAYGRWHIANKHCRGQTEKDGKLSWVQMSEKQFDSCTAKIEYTAPTGLNDLLVLVVPGGEGITYDSTIDEVLASPGLTSWRLGEYFEAQNQDRLPLNGWTFLVNEKTRENLTGRKLI